MSCSTRMPGVSDGTRIIDMPWYALHVGIRHAHHDDERRGAQVRREELVAVDDPLVAVALGVALELRGVGAAVRLGHRVAGEHLAVEQRLEPLLLLLRGAVRGDDLGVAGVGRRAAEDDGRPHRPAEQLVRRAGLPIERAGRSPEGAVSASRRKASDELRRPRPEESRRRDCPNRSRLRVFGRRIDRAGCTNDPTDALIDLIAKPGGLFDSRAGVGSQRTPSCPASTCGKKSSPSQGKSRTTEATHAPKNVKRKTFRCWRKKSRRPR